MKKRFLRAIFFGLIAIMAFQMVSAQTDREAAVAAAGDKYTISAKAGGVNYVEGTVSVVRKDGRSGYLTKRDEIAVGDIVSTGPNSRAEILLNPGSFLRIGPNSSFEFKTTSLDDLRIGLTSGSAIFEVFASYDFKVRVTTPKAKLLLIKSGVFRIDVAADGGANIEVWQGEALLGDKNATVLKGGFSAVLTDGVATVKTFDRKNTDEFEAWSKARGKELAKQSAALKNQALRGPLMNSFNSGLWGMYSSFGVWVYNRFTGGWCFLPFGDGWFSPYGFGFGSCICYWNLPPIVYNPPGGGGGQPLITTIATAGDRSPVPPFVRLQGSGGGRGISNSGGSGVNSSRSRPTDSGWNSSSTERVQTSTSTERVNTSPPPTPVTAREKPHQ